MLAAKVADLGLVSGTNMVEENIITHKLGRHTHSLKIGKYKQIFKNHISTPNKKTNITCLFLKTFFLFSVEFFMKDMVGAKQGLGEAIVVTAVSHMCIHAGKCSYMFNLFKNLYFSPSPACLFFGFICLR